LDHRRFWTAMDRLDEPALRAIESELGRRMVTEFDLDLSGLVVDMTNFATLIDSPNTRAPIAQRGKAKQKRLDLRLVGLALVVTRDGGIPLLSHPYPGDRRAGQGLRNRVRRLPATLRPPRPARHPHHPVRRRRHRRLSRPDLSRHPGDRARG
jgi:transposase